MVIHKGDICHFLLDCDTRLAQAFLIDASHVIVKRDVGSDCPLIPEVTSSGYIQRTMLRAEEEPPPNLGAASKKVIGECLRELRMMERAADQ